MYGYNSAERVYAGCNMMLTHDRFDVPNDESPPAMSSDARARILTVGRSANLVERHVLHDLEDGMMLSSLSESGEPMF